MPNIVINGGTITQTVDSGSTGQRSIVLRTKDTYVLEDIQVDVSASATAGTFANSVPAADESSYTTNNSPSTVIPAGGSLYLSGGWYPKQKIELGHLIPDIADNDAGTDQILYGYSAFDEDGNQITGTITTQTPSFDGGDVSTTATLHYTAPSGSIEPFGSFMPGNGQNQYGDEYGITTQDPGQNAVDGVDYLIIDAQLNTANNGSAYATSTANRTAVLYDGPAHYFVDESDNTVALPAPSTNATNTSTTQQIVLGNIVSDNFGKYFIPIVRPQGDGGDVTKTGQSGTVTCSLDNVTLASSGKFTDVGTGGVGTNYGVHSYTPTTQNPNPSGDDGVDYLKIQTSGSGGNATVSGTINVAYSRAAVKADSTYKGLVSMDANTRLLGNGTGTLEANVSTTSTATITGGSYYYIDIVEPKGSAPSITATGISDTLAFPSNGAPTVNSYIKGTIVPGTGSANLGDEYGVTLTRPSGTEGTNFLTIEPGSSRTAGTLSGNATITFTRGAVNANSTYKGAVSMTTSTELVAQATGQTVTQSLSKTITPDTTFGDNLYIPISKPGAAGGGLTGDSSITITATGSPTSGVTPDVGLYSKSGNNPQGTTPVDSTYGVQTTTPTSGNWVVLDPVAMVDNVDVSASIRVGREAVSVSGRAGLWNGTGTGLTAITPQQYTGTSSVAIPVNGGQSKYVPVVSSATMSGGSLPTITLVTPTVETGTTTSGTTNIDVTPQTNLLLRRDGIDTPISASDELNWGITETPRDNDYVVLDPDATSGNYKKVLFSKSITRPAVTVTVGAGITAGFTETLSEETKTYSGDTAIGTSIQTGTNKYINVVNPSVSTPNFSSVVNPTVTTTTSAAKKVGSASPTTAPSGVVTSTTAPSDLTTYSAGYIIVSPGSSSSSNGSITASATASINPGITRGGMVNAAPNTYSTITTTVNNDNGAKTYIKIYDGSYNVS